MPKSWRRRCFCASIVRGSSYRAEAKFTTWLYRIATNLAVNHARDTRHERSAQTVYLDAPDEETGTTPDVADDEPTAEQQHAAR